MMEREEVILSSSGNSSNNVSLGVDKILTALFGDFSTETIVLIILYGPVFILAFIGNCLLVLLIVLSERLRSMTNLYLCNLAIADASVSIVCIPMAVGQAIYRVWIFGSAMCKISTFLQGVTVSASVFTITILSVDRYLAIRHPMIFRRISTAAMAGKLICGVWLLSIGIMSPLLVIRKIDVITLIPDEPIYFCAELWPTHRDRQIYDICLFVIVYIIPGSIITICYGLIGRQLWSEDVDLNRSESEFSKGIGQRVMSGRKRVAKMLIALALLFATCWLPYYIVSLYLDFSSENSEHFIIILPYTIFLGHMNSAINPIVYFYASRSFRKCLIRLLHCRKTRGRKAKRVNLLVHYKNENGNVQTKLWRNPLIKILSSSSSSIKSKSSSSFKFSRSSNTSLKSNNSTKTFDLASPSKRQDKLPGVGANNEMSPNIIVELEIHDCGSNDSSSSSSTKHKKIMNTSLSIPTTIKEESSRSRSSSVGLRDKDDVIPLQTMKIYSK